MKALEKMSLEYIEYLKTDPWIHHLVLSIKGAIDIVVMAITIIVVILYYRNFVKSFKKVIHRESIEIFDFLFMGVFLSALGVGVINRGFWGIYNIIPLDHPILVGMGRFGERWPAGSLLAVIGYVLHVMAILRVQQASRRVQGAILILIGVIFALTVSYGIST